VRSMKAIVTLASILAIGSFLAACSGSPKCESEGRYTLGREGKRIQAPDGLDDLESGKEMEIPRASPQVPREDTGKCIEAPPAIQTS
jgi:hypothetical protein